MPALGARGRPLVRILLCGRGGQLGWQLERHLAPQHELCAVDRLECDFSDPAALQRLVRAVRPQAIVNAAAWTDVEAAERDPPGAMRINATAPAVLAEEAKRGGALLVHYSTDYVFDGEKSSPYGEEDRPNPLNAYGRSKLEGERAILGSGARALVLRTAWLYESRGRNFVRTILRLARERSELRVVRDQVGSPTAAREVAAATARLLARRDPPEGLYHLSAAGETSWHGFACEILRRAGLGHVHVEPIASAQYPSAVRRPRYSVLANERIARAAAIRLADWRAPLAQVLAELAVAA